MPANTKESSNDQEVLPELIALLQKAASTNHRHGVLNSAVFDEIRTQAIKEVGRPFFSLVKAGSLAFCRPTPPLIYPNSELEAQQLWSEGITANLQNLHLRNQFFYNLCNSMSSELGNQVTVSLYLSQPSGTSFSWHTDEWENLCIQVHGAKVFQLSTENKVTSITLSSGDWLRVDPNEQHKAFSRTISAHLSFGRHRKYLV